VGNFLPFVAALLLAVLSLDRPSGDGASLPGLALLLGGYWAAGRALSGSLAARIAREGGDGRGLGRFRRAVALHRHLALPAHAAALWPLGWSAAAARLPGPGGAVAVALAFLPWPLLLVLSRSATWPAERLLGLESGRLRESLGRSARMGGLVGAPILLATAVLVGAATLDAAGVPPFRQVADLAARWDFVQGILVLGILAGVLSVFPVMAMGILGARPMPPGPLRERLEAYARRVGLGYRDLFVWPTGGSLPNAAVMGVGRRLRCVVFTDALLERLDDDEVEAVFAHEAGHAIHHHIPLFFVFTVVWMLAVAASERLLPPEVAFAVRSDPVAATGLVLAGIVVYFGLLLGFVSRRLEQQADVHGLLTTGLPEGEEPAAVLREPARHPLLRAVAESGADPGAHPFVASLEGLGASMGGMREITGWRHFSIADRVEFLRRFAAEPEVRERYRRRLRLLLGVLAAVFALFLAAAAADLPRQFEGPEPGAAFRRAEAALLRGEPAAAREWLEEGLRGGAARGSTLGPDPAPVPPGAAVADLSLLRIAEEASRGDLPRSRRSRFRSCEALLRSALGRHGEAIAAAEDAVALLGDDGAARGAARPALLVAAEVLDRAGRPAAAAAARRDAAGP